MNINNLNNNFNTIMPENNNKILVTLLEKQIESFRKLAKPMSGEKGFNFNAVS